MPTVSEAAARGMVRLASLGLLVLSWELAAAAAHSRMLPAPGTVLQSLAGEWASGRFVHHLAATLQRVALSFLLAMACGTAIGLAVGRSRRLDALFDLWIVLLLNIPALVIIVLAYVWLGLNETALVTAVALNKLPSTVITVREGARGLDRDLAEMAACFRLDGWRGFRHLVLPQLFPYLMVAARSGLSLIWKIVLVAELLGRSDGIGFMIQLDFQLFDVSGILAYTIGFAVVIQAIEWGGLQPLERRAGRWRR